MNDLLLKILGLYLNGINMILPETGGKHAFFIFCYPFKAKLSARQQAFLNSSYQFSLPIEDFKIKCYKWGNGPKNILFVHGWQSNTYRWKKYIEAIPKNDFTIYSFDAPGHGNSGSRIANVPLFEKSIRKIFSHVGEFESIISHSLGSFSSLYFIKQNPQFKLKKLVALATPDNIHDFIEYYFSMLNLSQKTKQNVMKYFIHYAQKDLSFFRLEKLIDNPQSRGLIIHDKNDESVSVNYSKKLHNLWPQSKLVLTEGLGHKLRSDKIVDMVKEFVASPI